MHSRPGVGLDLIHKDMDIEPDARIDTRTVESGCPARSRLHLIHFLMAKS